MPKPFELKSEKLCELRKILLTLNSQKPVVFTYMLLHPCEGYFPCRGVITNLFPVEAILVTCARGRSGKMDAVASLASSLACLNATKLPRKLTRGGETLPRR